MFTIIITTEIEPPHHLRGDKGSPNGPSAPATQGTQLEFRRRRCQRRRTGHVVREQGASHIPKKWGQTCWVKQVPVDGMR